MHVQTISIRIFFQITIADYIDIQDIPVIDRATLLVLIVLIVLSMWIAHSESFARVCVWPVHFAYVSGGVRVGRCTCRPVYVSAGGWSRTEAAAVESRPAPPRVARRATVARTESYTNIEQHPLINALLRNETRIRRITRALDAGHHATQPGGESCAQTCRENDGEVLRRQLEKVERWRRCEATFTRENLDDLQLIVAAVGSHLRSV